MIPDLYHTCLRWISQRDDLPPCRFQRAQLNQIVALEEELASPLPVEYEEHLLHLGWGEEHGGVAHWLGLDLSRSGNILSENNTWLRRGKPPNFLAIYNFLGDSLFGYFLADNLNSTCSDEIHIWEDGQSEPYARSLGEFYQKRLDCSPEEILALESGELSL